MAQYTPEQLAARTAWIKEGAEVAVIVSRRAAMAGATVKYGVIARALKRDITVDLWNPGEGGEGVREVFRRTGLEFEMPRYGDPVPTTPLGLEKSSSGGFDRTFRLLIPLDHPKLAEVQNAVFERRRGYEMANALDLAARQWNNTHTEGGRLEILNALERAVADYREARPEIR